MWLQISDSLPSLCHHRTIPNSHLLHTVQNVHCECVKWCLYWTHGQGVPCTVRPCRLMSSWHRTVHWGLGAPHKSWLPSSQPVGADTTPKIWSPASHTPPPSSACAGAEDTIAGYSESLKANFKLPGTIVCFDLGWPVLLCIFRAGLLPECYKYCLNSECVGMSCCTKTVSAETPS